jgi:hypothetical protein
MAISKKQFVFDVLGQISQLAPSDDIEVSEKQVAFWGSYELNRLVAAELNEKTKRGEPIPAIYIKRTELETAALEAEAGVEEEDERIYVTLDEEPLTLNKMSEIVTVLLDDGTEVKRSDIQTVQSLKHLRFAKPSADNLIYYRQSPLKLFVEGLKSPDLSFDKLFVFYVPKQDIMALGDDDDILVSDLVLPDVISATVQRGMLALYGTQADRSNDGDGSVQNQYHSTISNRQE